MKEKMEELIKKIDKAIEKEYFRSGHMGTEPVNASLTLTDEEKEEFLNIGKYSNDEHYYWEMDGSTLYISYTEDV